MLDVVDRRGVERRVVEQNFDACGTGVFQSENAPVVEQIREATRCSRVVAGLLVGEQKTFAVQVLCRRQTELRIQ